MCSTSRPESLYGAVSARLGGLEVPPKPTVSTILCNTPARRGWKAGSGGAGGGEAFVPVPRLGSVMAWVAVQLLLVRIESDGTALHLHVSPARLDKPRQANERWSPRSVEADLLLRKRCSRL
jgi:hypothetical protein